MPNPRLRRYWFQIRSKGARYWIGAAVLALIGWYAGSELGKQRVWIDKRYELYQLLQSFAPIAPFPKRTAIVLIGDEDYWRGELARRVPVKRDFLAVLVTKLAVANAAVIALDFDFRSPVPDGTLVDNSDYVEETTALATAIREASKKTFIVLPQTVGFDSTGKYQLESDIFANTMLGESVRRGYIALPYDLRQLPLGLDLADGTELDSFSEAIARGTSPNALARLPISDTLPYGSYIQREAFSVVSAGSVTKGDSEALKSVAHKVVIVGGGWSRFAFNRGEAVDSYMSPIGRVPGVFLHANFVESILDGRAFPPWKRSVENAFEGVTIVAIALVFALGTRARDKLLGIAGVSFLLLIFTYISWQNLGKFFDFFIPIALLAAHAVAEQVMAWRERAYMYDRGGSREFHQGGPHENT